MVLIVGAALAVTSTLPLTGKALDVPNPLPTSLKTGDHVRVQTERRRTARAAINSADAIDASLVPMLRRAEADDALTTTRTLLDKTDSHIRSGRTEEACLTIDQAAVTLERAKNLLPTDIRVIDLDMRERDLRRELNQPSLPSGKIKNDAAKSAPVEQPVAPPKRDELPTS